MGFGGQLFGGGVFGGGQPAPPQPSYPVHLSDILYRAYRLSGILKGPMRGLSPEENQEGLVVVNPLMDQWNAERLTIYTIPRLLFNLVAGQQSYAIGIAYPNGPAPDWSLMRPAKIDYASIVLQGNAPYPLELPMQPLTYVDWQHLPTKQVPSQFPIWFYYDAAFPFGNFNVYPLPQAVNQIALYTGQLLTQFAAVTDAVIMPYGYLKAIQYQVALELCMHWRFPVTPDLRKEAQEAIGKIKSMNAPILDMACDAAVIAKGGHYNWFFDGYQKRR